MATTDRIDGLVTAVAIKAPVEAATTANVTLSGLQTVDGVSLAADDRVLVKDQTTGTENGLYSVQTGSWERTADANGNRDMTEGTLVIVKNGTVNGSTIWKQSTAGSNTDGTLTFGTDSPAFAQAEFFVATVGALKYSFDSSTTTGEDPGDGDFRLDNATISSATTITFSNNSADSGTPDVSDFIVTWDDSTNSTSGTITIQEVGAPEIFAIFNVTGAVTDGTDYLDVAVTYVTGSGSFTAGNNYGVFFVRAGDQGSGFVSGPGSSTDNAVARFDGTDGSAVQNSSVLIDDSDNVSGIANLTFTGSFNAPAGAVATADIADNAVDETKLKDALIPDFSEVVVTASDSFLLADADDSNNTKRDTVQGILDLAGGGTEFISTIDYAGETNDDMTGLDAAKYDGYEIRIANDVPGSDAVHYEIQTSTDGGSTFDAGASDYTFVVHRDGNFTVEDTFDASHTAFAITGIATTANSRIGSAAGEDGISGTIRIYGPHLAKQTTANWDVTYTSEGGANNTAYVTGGGVRLSSADVDAFRSKHSSGTHESGTRTLYGFKNA